MATTTDIRPVPPELRHLARITAVYLASLRDVVPMLEQTADVNAVVRPEYGHLLDQLRTALRSREMGTPSAIERIVTELLGLTSSAGRG